MVDRLGRKIDYMRISVTDRCNFRCGYCMPPQGTALREREEILSYEEILKIARAAVRLGITHFRVTGGEPLVRRGILEFLRELSDLPGTASLGITTNGSLLGACLEELKEIGIGSINVSLDTLDRERFARLTGRDELPRVLEGVRRAASMGFARVKVNCVLMGGINEEEVCSLAALARDNCLDVRFIEMMPVGLGTEFSMISQDQAAARLEQCYGPIVWEEKRADRGRGPAVYGHLDGFLGDVGFISAMSHPFCEGCSRIRLLSDGGLKACLNEPCQVNLRDLIRQGASGRELEETLARVIWNKPAGHGWERKKRQENGKKAGEEREIFMSSIGG